MKHTGLRLLSFVTALLCVPCFLLLLQRIPCKNCTVKAASTSTGSTSYTDSALLTQRLEAIFAGDCNLFLDADRTPIGTPLSLGSALNTSTCYYAFTDTGYTTGFQCYIYAQGVYAKLFGEAPYHGAASARYKQSVQVMGQAPEADAALFESAHVMPGAYLRTTIHADGTYDGNSGHSLIILGYSDTSVTVLEGNADGRGLIRKALLTWEQFNRSYLSGRERYISHIVQPMDTYYRDVYGLCYAFDEQGVALQIPTHTLRRSGQTFQLYAAGNVTRWQSDNPAIATVDAQGVVTAHENGIILVTAQTGAESESFVMIVEIVLWEALGDVDGSGAADSEDAVLVLRQYIGTLANQQNLLTDAQMHLADIDNDNRVTAVDAEAILRYYLCFLVGEAGAEPEMLWRGLLAH